MAGDVNKNAFDLKIKIKNALYFKMGRGGGEEKHVHKAHCI